MAKVSVREERDDDVLEVRHVLERAFDRPREAELAERLREHHSERMALVAEQHGQVVGYCLLSATTIDAPVGRVAGMAFAPLAIMPRLQGKGTATALIDKALKRLKRDRYPYAVALGAPGFYARFGFRPVRFYEVYSEDRAMPEDACMLLPLDARRMLEISGGVRLHPELAAALFQPLARIPVTCPIA